MDKKIKLSGMKLPDDIKKLTYPQLEQLCHEIRKRILISVEENGGHLSSNLGTVELTVALHRVFDSPADKIVWDVGHQAYTHKILTGRADAMAHLRRRDGISGFARPDESEHDAFISGHSSNSISAACGIARAMGLKGDDHHVIAVIGDGAFTGGLAYEGLNNAGKNSDNLIVILNDNEMSISKNVGALSRHLAAIRARKSYISVKNRVERTLDRTPVVGAPIKSVMMSSKDTIRYFMYRYTGYSGSTMFENMGFVYLGPVDGHDLKELEQYLEAAKAVGKPVLLHVNTVKGKGYAPAEKNPGAFHALSPHMLSGGDPAKISENSFSAVMGKELSALADRDDRICAVTAAMKYGVGLNTFAAAHPERFFDVGIAEGHAVTFAAGLATQGMIPVFAVYSSFLQRSYDQVIHDAAIGNTHIVLCVDRSGFTGEDGETHQGIFDIPMLSSVPNCTIFAPADYSELKECLYTAIYDTEGIAVVRYPKGSAQYKVKPCTDAEYRLIRKGSKALAVSFGRTGAFLEACQADIGTDILRVVKIHPIERDIINICQKYSKIYIFEESSLSGGFGEHLSAALAASGWRGKVKLVGAKGFVPVGSPSQQLEMFGLDEQSILAALSGKTHET